MENDFDGRKAVGANNRTRVFQYLDVGRGREFKMRLPRLGYVKAHVPQTR